MRKLSMLCIGVVALLFIGAWSLAAVDGAGMSKIRTFSMQQSDGSPKFIIGKEGAAEYQDFMLEDPFRLVIDFVGARHELERNTYEGDGRVVAKVRTSQFTNEPKEITRIVFDLKGKSSYKISKTGDAVVVQFFEGGKAPSAGTGQASPAPTRVVRKELEASEESGRIRFPWETRREPTGSKAPAATTSTAPAPTGTTPTTSAAPATPANPTAPTTSAAPATPVTPVTKPEAGAAARTPTPPVSTGSKAATPGETARPATSTPETAVNPPPATPQPRTNPFTTRPVTTSVTPPPHDDDDEGDAPESQVPMVTSWTRRPPMANTGESPPTEATTPPVPSYAASVGLVRNRNITIDVQQADVKTVLRSLSEFSGINIIAGPEVTGTVTAHLKNLPWRQAMDIILKSHGFGYREEYGVIRVSTIDKLTKEELELQAAERKKDELLPLVTRIIPLSYANAAEMRDALKEILGSRGNMEIEKGSNALIVTDIEKTVTKIDLMVKELDKKINQVEIVAKMVDVDFEASREMGIRWDFLNLSLADVNGVASGSIEALTATPVGTFRVGTVQSWGEVQTIIETMERTNKANIISNPRIVTADNREASILVGKEIPLIVSDEAGNPITELTKVGIILKVTPHVNSDNSITLDLHPEVSELAAQATVQGGVIISLSEADTRVVVDNGETAVIGGLISEVETTLENGIPVLKDIPVLGNLFKLKNKTKKKRELIIFVTPRIVPNMAKKS